MKTTTRILSIIIVLVLLAGCSPAATPAPTATNTPAPTATITLTPTVTPSPTPTLTPTPAGPEMSAEKQDYLNGFEEVYRVADENGVQAVLVTHNGQEYKVLVEENGVWVRNYDDMAKFVHENGTFDTEAGNVFSFGVEETKDDQDRKVITINKDDYRRYKEAVAKIFEGLDPAGLAFLEVNYVYGSASLTSEKEVQLDMQRSGWPQVIGWASHGGIQIVTLATDKGPISVCMVKSKIIDFGKNDTAGDAVSEMSRVANNDRDTEA